MSFNRLIFVAVAVILMVGISECKKEISNEVHNYNDIYKDCGSETGTIVTLSVTDCKQVPCLFVRGKNYTMDLKFTSKVDSNAAENKVYGIIAKVPVPFHLPNDNGCTLGISCPFKAGVTVSESVTLPVLAEYPAISLYVEWKVIDDKGKQLVCFEFPVKLA